ncbi:hypothetical protein ITJ38_10095 [Agreia pratensis]|uniref:hypothetical protein n=1 Tax=Agreia pratensis TaxID=150121 RepID=UPI00188C06C5|nr:hypothetical protein [Agreia pratensis]MBF4634751.1 hypothetical protein [Agreia pratensis]
MNLHYLTPAGRLFELLKYIADVRTDKKADLALAAYYGIDLEGGLAEYVGALGETLLLPRAARESVESRPARDVARKRLERALVPVDAMFSMFPALGSYQVKHIADHFDAGTLSDLETASELLSEHLSPLEDDGPSEEEPDAESSVEKIRRLATELSVEAMNADIPYPVAIMIWKNCQDVIWAVHMFKVVGPEGVIRDFDRLFGAMVLRPEAASAIANTPTLREKLLDLGKSVVLLGAAVAVPGQIAVEAANLYKTIEPLLNAATQG